MTKEEIRSMFLLAAKVRHTPPCERGRDMLEMALEGAVEQYRDEVLSKVGSPAPAGEAVPWQQALEYVGALFQEQDLNESEKDHARMSAFRRGAWETIANGTTNWYQSSGKKKPQGENHRFN